MLHAKMARTRLCATALACFSISLASPAPASWRVSVWPENNAGEVGGFYTLQQIGEALDELERSFPGCCDRSSIGTSIEGRPIPAICTRVLGSHTGAHTHTHTGATNATYAEALITAMHHAREPLGMMVGLGLLFDVLNTATRGSAVVLSLLSRRSICVLPVVNPDAYAYNTRPERTQRYQRMARKNRRPGCSVGNYADVGVDLNRNYDFEWSHDERGSSGLPCGEDYRGSAPFSEPETAAVRDFVAQHNFTTAANFHSFGRFVNLPYAVQDIAPPSDDEYAVFLALAESYALVTGFDYGHPWTGGLYTVNGETSDWMYAAHGIYATSPELGPEANAPFEEGMWPNAEEIPALRASGIALAQQAVLRAGAALGVARAKGPIAGTGRAPLQLAVDSCGMDCQRVTARLRITNEGVLSASGAVLASLVPANARASLATAPGAASVAVDMWQLVQAAAELFRDPCADHACTTCQTKLAPILVKASVAGDEPVSMDRSAGAARSLRGSSLDLLQDSPGTRVASDVKHQLRIRNSTTEGTPRGIRQLAHELSEAMMRPAHISRARAGTRALVADVETAFAAWPSAPRMWVSEEIMLSADIVHSVGAGAPTDSVCAEHGGVLAWLVVSDDLHCSIWGIGCDGSTKLVAPFLLSSGPLCALLRNSSSWGDVIRDSLPSECIPVDATSSPSAVPAPTGAARSPAAPSPAAASATASPAAASASPAAPASPSSVPVDDSTGENDNTFLGAPSWPWMRPDRVSPTTQGLTVLLSAVGSFAVLLSLSVVVAYRSRRRHAGAATR